MFSFYKILALLLFMCASMLHGKDCALQIAGSDMMQYDKKVLQVDSSCSRVTVTLTHSGQLPKAAMGHNWVLTKVADKEATRCRGGDRGAAGRLPAEGRRTHHCRDKHDWRQKTDECHLSHQQA